MTRRIRITGATSFFIEEFLSSIKDRTGPMSISETDELDLLLKHAIQSNSSAVPAPNTKRVWKKLSGRVRGPFGRIAVEGPMVSEEQVAVGHGRQVPFTLGDDAALTQPHNSQETNDQHSMAFGRAKEVLPLT